MRLLLFALVMCCFLNVNSQEVRNFKLKDIGNNLKDFSDLKGSKLTLIDFWATWCKPCVKAIPELNKIYETYKNHGVKIIGISCDGPRSISKVAPLSRALQIKYPVLLDINSEVKSDLNLYSFPTLIIVNEENKIVWIHEGFVAEDEKEIRSKIDEFLK